MLNKTQRREMMFYLRHARPATVGAPHIAALLELLHRCEDLEKVEELRHEITDLSMRLTGARRENDTLRAQLTTWRRHVEQAMREKQALRPTLLAEAREEVAEEVRELELRLAQAMQELEIARLPWWRRLMLSMRLQRRAALDE